MLLGALGFSHRLAEHHIHPKLALRTLASTPQGSLMQLHDLGLVLFLYAISL